MRQPPRLDFLWAALCIVGAVFFMLRAHPTAETRTAKEPTHVVGNATASAPLTIQ